MHSGKNTHPRQYQKIRVSDLPAKQPLESWPRAWTGRPSLLALLVTLSQGLLESLASLVSMLCVQAAQLSMTPWHVHWSKGAPDLLLQHEWHSVWLKINQNSVEGFQWKSVLSITPPLPTWPSVWFPCSSPDMLCTLWLWKLIFKCVCVYPLAAV